MYIEIGKIVNTHGIKGELKLLSDFEFKNKVFKKDMVIYIGNKKDKEIIRSYRSHKCFDMITLSDYSNINEVLKYKGLYAFVLKDELVLDKGQYLDKDLIGLKVLFNEEEHGIIKDIELMANKTKLLVIDDNTKKVLIPYNDSFINKIDMDKQEIVINYLEGLF